MKLAEATVVITGGARRVGRHIATVLAQHGANIVLNYHTSAEEAQQATTELSSYGVTAILLRLMSRPGRALNRFVTLQFRNSEV